MARNAKTNDLDLFLKGNKMKTKDVEEDMQLPRVAMTNGNRKLLRSKLNEGFSEFSVGGGEWVKKGTRRIVSIFAFFRADGIVSTREQCEGMVNMHGQIMKGEYTLYGRYGADEFDSMKREYRLEMSPKTDMSQMLRSNNHKQKNGFLRG